MASEVTRSTFAALALPSSRVGLNTTDTVVTQAGPLPGTAEPQQTTGMVLKSSGSQSAGGGLEVQTQRGGYPGSRSSSGDGASYIWRDDGDADTIWRGWDVPNLYTAIECIQFADGTGTGVTLTQHPHAIRLADHSILVAYQATDLNDASPTTYEIRTQRKPDSAAWGAAVTAVSWTTLPSPHFRPCLVLLGSGRIMLYYWVDDATAELTQIRALYSDDDGDTWALAQDACLETSISSDAATGFAVQRIRGAAKDGQVMLVVHIHRNDGGLEPDGLIQYASSDGGLNFTEVWESTDSGVNLQQYGYPDVTTTAGRFVVAYMDDATGAARVRVVGSAYSALSIPTAVTAGGRYALTGAPMTQGNLTIVEDETGTLYLLGVNPVAGLGLVWRSTDGGESWATISSQSWWNTNDTSATSPNYIAGVCAEGRVALLHNHIAAHNTTDVTLWCGYLGGYSSVTMPGITRYAEQDSRVDWFWNWLPYETPDQVGWTKVTVGSTATLTSGYLNLNTAADTLYYYKDLLGTIDEPIICRFDAEVVSGGDIAAADVSVRVLQDDGAEDYDVTIYLAVSGGTTQYRVYDNNAGAPVGAQQDTGGALGSVLVCLDGTSIKTWHRDSGASSKASDRKWTAGVSSTTLSDGGGTGVGNHRLEWGHRVATTSVSRWHEMHHVPDEDSGPGLIDEVNPDDLYGRPYSVSGTFVEDGVVVRAAGPTIRADRWDIDTRHEYGIARILEAGYQPRRRWRSTGTAAETIVVDLADVAADSWVGEALYVGFYGSTLSQVTLSGYTGAAWVGLGTADSFDNLDGLKFDRLGDTLRPETASASTNSPYLQRNEVAGGYFQLSATVSRTIESQREGKWTPTASPQVTPWLVLEDVVNATDPSTGTAGRIVPPNWGVIIHTRGVRYTKLRIVQPAAAAGVPGPPSGYWELGALVVAPLMPLSEEPSWGRVIEETSNVEVSEARDWTISSYKPSPSRRVAEFAWSDAWDHTKSSGYSADPNYYEIDTNASAEPVANIRNIGTQIQGAVRELGGSDTAVVWLPRVAVGSAALQVINRRDLHILGRLGATTRLEQVQGLPGSTDVWRIPTLALTEVV